MCALPLMGISALEATELEDRQQLCSAFHEDMVTAATLACMGVRHLVCSSLPHDCISTIHVSFDRGGMSLGHQSKTSNTPRTISKLSVSHLKRMHSPMPSFRCHQYSLHEGCSSHSNSGMLGLALQAGCHHKQGDPQDHLIVQQQVVWGI